MPREKLFVTTKASCHEGDTIDESLTRSLTKLGLDYVDLYLIHQPYFAKTPEDLQKRWADMEAVQAAGKARSIGVSNYLQEHLEPLLATAKVVPAVNQIEFHPYLQRRDLLDFNRKHGIAIAAYGPLVAITKGAPGPVDPVYDDLAKKYGVTTGEVALRLCIDQDVIAVTTSSSEQRLQSIFAKVPAFKLTPEEVNAISEAGSQKEFQAFGRRRT